MAAAKTKASTKRPAKKPVRRTASKPVAKKRSAAAMSNQEYSQLTWNLVLIWLALIAVFLVLVFVKYN